MRKNPDAQYTPPMDHSQHLSNLSRPRHRYGDIPTPKIKVWEGSGTSAAEFEDGKKEVARNTEHEREAITRWLRGGQDGGVEGVAKELNRSLTGVRAKLKGFETSNGKHHWKALDETGLTTKTASSLSSL
mmetsp:Transcript_34792/g.48239  ORF Transcript_34792/g.48239 Transcript_34792/m.48239 type:complete len:130 (+) Transcript_34792:43-432(+)|eukprot:CAMPEP_0196573180 /NCGR_PEP_ID=MMETSP1081-20130531/3119_1 /TAXON_ID=36882 /ORGANISM="Pyramimonas amylifera, Strain CCMP720" /LENGTH=129 /DNA_ID=CAMNT_0041890799 /DNA_START=58 /DNA_END=447 /DNA_ORIENTATION=-